MRIRTVSGLSVSLAALTMAAPALAQTALDATDEIIVTATKRAQSLQDVNQSVAVLQDELLEDISSGGEDILFLSARVPSLYAESSFGRTFPRFYIRGLGNTDFDLNANQPVSLVYDGIVQENPVLKGYPVFDLDRVEVLRGPQGTLFGRNTPAGVVKFESARPVFEREGYLRGSFARFDTIDIEGAVNLPLNDKIALRVSGIHQQRDDFVDNEFEGGDQDGFGEFEEFAGRAQLLIEPREGFSILANVHGRTLDGGSQLFRANVVNQGSNDFREGFERFSAAQDATQSLNVDGLGANLRVDADVGNGTVTSVTGWESIKVEARGDVDGGVGAAFLGEGNFGPGFIPFPAESQDDVDDHGQFTQELRYNWDATPQLNATLGAFAFFENLELENFSNDTLSGGAVNGFGTQQQDTLSLALFGSAEYALSDQLGVTAGLRVTREDKDFTARRIIGPFGSGTFGPVSVDLNDTVVTGDLTVNYDFTDDVAVYARYARGFRAPNVQGRVVFGDVVTVADTETIDSLEAGYKGRYFDGRARLNLAAFYYLTDDQQLTAVGGAGNFNQLLNADAVQGFGFEAEAQFAPIDGLELSAGVSLNDTEIQDELLEVGGCGAPCTITNPLAASGNPLIDGNPLPQAPRWIANGSARYGLPVGDGGELYASGDVAYRSRVNFFLYESVEFQGDPLTEVGLRGGYIHNDGQFEVAAFGRNVFNATELEGAVDFNNFTGFINEPTIYGVEVVTRF